MNAEKIVEAALVAAGQLPRHSHAEKKKCKAAIVAALREIAAQEHHCYPCAVICLTLADELEGAKL